MITIDQRGCGEGKTTQGIYQKIIQNKLSNNKTLIAVPSKDLQQKYKQDFPDCIIVNSEVVTDTTTQEINKLMEDGKELIVITHQAFIRLNNTGFHNYYHLIIDEAIEDIVRYKYVNFSGDDTLASIHWQKRFYPTKLTKEYFDTTTDNSWYEMSLVSNNDDNIIIESQTYREIVDPNHIHYMRKIDYKNMMERTGIIHFMSQLDIKLLDNWKSVHIACAAFEKTKMYHWLVSHNVSMKVTTEFKAKEGNIHVYTSNDPKFKWSKSKLDKYENLMTDFHKQVNNFATGKVIVIRNNGRVEKLSNERRLSHNVHGINDSELISLTNVSLDSSLNPKPLESDFVCQIFNFDKPRSNETKQKIRHMYMYHLFYQVIMRCKLRDQNYNNEQINIFCPDQDIAVGLSFYLGIIESIEMDFSNKQKVSKAKSGKERTREWRNRKKLNAIPANKK